MYFEDCHCTHLYHFPSGSSFYILATLCEKVTLKLTLKSFPLESPTVSKRQAINLNYASHGFIPHYKVTPDLQNSRDETAPAYPVLTHDLQSQ